jgi:hypothetical protein
MPIFNLSLIADRVNYYQNAGMSVEESKAKALEDLGYEQEFAPEINAELDKLINNEQMTEMSNTLGNDKDKLIDRNNGGTYEPYDLNPETPPTPEETPTE